MYSENSTATFIITWIMLIQGSSISLVSQSYCFWMIIEFTWLQYLNSWKIVIKNVYYSWINIVLSVCARGVISSCFHWPARPWSYKIGNYVSIRNVIKIQWKIKMAEFLIGTCINYSTIGSIYIIKLISPCIYSNNRPKRMNILRNLI